MEREVKIQRIVEMRGDAPFTLVGMHGEEYITFAPSPSMGELKVGDVMWCEVLKLPSNNGKQVYHLEKIIFSKWQMLQPTTDAHELGMRIGAYKGWAQCIRKLEENEGWIKENSSYFAEKYGNDFYSASEVCAFRDGFAEAIKVLKEVK